MHLYTIKRLVELNGLNSQHFLSVFIIIREAAKKILNGRAIKRGGEGRSLLKYGHITLKFVLTFFTGFLPCFPKNRAILDQKLVEKNCQNLFRLYHDRKNMSDKIVIFFDVSL